MESFEKKLYEMLGIKQYKKFVLFCKQKYNKLTNSSNNDNYLLKGYSSENLLFLRDHLIKNMKIHLLGVVIGLVVMIAEATDDPFQWSVFLCGLFIALFNLYSVILQRYNLLRIKPLIK